MSQSLRRRSSLCQCAKTFARPTSGRQAHQTANVEEGCDDKPSTTVGAATGAWWREFLTEETLQRIDTLTYLLGRYPRRLSESVTPKPDEATALLTGSTTAASNSHSNSLGAKKKKLVALNARAVPTRPPVKANVAERATTSRDSVCADARSVTPTSSPFSTPSSSSSSVRRLWSPDAHQTLSLHAAPAAAGPHTPPGVVETLAQQWLRRDRKKQAEKAKVEATAEAVQQQLLQHPPSLFSDEAAVCARFGMGGVVSPQTHGFTGLFRQRWQDFHVTEMVTAVGVVEDERGGLEMESADSTDPLRRRSRMTTGCGGGVPLSRNFDFRIPPLPAGLLGGMEASAASVDVTGGAPALSFFAVDVKQRIRELQTEEVRDTDRAAAAEALAKERTLTNAKVLPASTAEDDVEGEGADEGGIEPLPDPANRSIDENTLTGRPSTYRDAGFDETEAEQSYESSHYYLQCTLHKQHLAHGNTMALIAQTLRMHPRSISVAGIKDYVGDTVQRVRLENVSPAAALEANRRFRQKRVRMTLSDFSYEQEPLSPGDLFGNHFRVVLRDVDVPKSELADAIAVFGARGFPNYYGCQRFSWFAGRQDAAFALLRHNWLAFAFLFLNFTDKDRSLRELLQRHKKFPHPSQDEYRRNVVRRLRQIAIEPGDLDVAPFLSCPSLSAPLTHADGRPFSEVQEMICAQLREAYFDLHAQSRRLTAQRLSSYLWNQVLTLRLHHVGGQRLLDGDLVAPASVRQLSTGVGDRQDWYRAFGDRVTSENGHRYTIEDVVHPGFSFDAITLPDNVIGDYYEQVCGKYGLDWRAQHSKSGLRDFREPPRPIIRRPLNLRYEYNQDAKLLTLRFALERGCYANVALSELMKTVRCLGSEDVTVLPLPESLWEALGKKDPGYVTTLQDIYGGFEDGVGFLNDETAVEVASGSETKVWDHSGPLFLPESEDPFRKAHAWGSQHLLRNSERREKEAEDMKRLLFDRPLAKQLKEGEVDTYAGHIVPLPPNASARRVYAKVMQRRRRYAGSPKMVTRMKRSTLPSSSRRGGGNGEAKRLPSFQSLNKNSWNFTW